MRNKFPGTCYRCGEHVAAGEGHFEYENAPGLRWPQGQFQRNWPLVQHAACAITFRGTNTHYVFAPSGANVGSTGDDEVILND